MNADDYMRTLRLIPHPEGGQFREIYRNPRKTIFEGFNGARSLGTSIYFLLREGEESALHRIKSDEIWYFHDGGTLEIIELEKDGSERITHLGRNIQSGEVLQHVVPAGTWFGARLKEGTEFCLVGCQVSPGFDFRDFELKPKGRS